MAITKTLHSLYILLIFLLKMWPVKTLIKLTVQRTLHPAVPAKKTACLKSFTFLFAYYLSTFIRFSLYPEWAVEEATSADS